MKIFKLIFLFNCTNNLKRNETSSKLEPNSNLVDEINNYIE